MKLDATPHISAVIPVYNEEGNLPALLEELGSVLTPYEYEIVFVDDGSTDGSFDLLRSARERDGRIKILQFNGNFGQLAAFAAGFQVAKGSIIAMLDSDLQNNPADLPKFIEEVEKNGNVAAFGWRVNRKNSFFLRQIPSKIFNMIRNRFIEKPLHDYGCAMNVFRREFIDELSDRPEYLKHITTYIASKRAQFVEVQITERKRKAGRSAYNFMRLLQLGLDILITTAHRPVATALLLVATVVSAVLGLAALAVGFGSFIAGERPLLEYIALPYMFFLGGLVTSVLALINERVSGLLRNMHKKPVYVIREYLD
jgi:glycosyltransferase involved in cell wall biosynthesis